MTAGSLHHSPGWADHPGRKSIWKPWAPSSQTPWKQQGVKGHSATAAQAATSSGSHGMSLEELIPEDTQPTKTSWSTSLRTKSSDHQTPVWQGSWKINKYVEIKNTPIDKWFKGKSKGHQNIAGVKGRWGRPQAKSIWSRRAHACTEKPRSPRGGLKLLLKELEMKLRVIRGRKQQSSNQEYKKPLEKQYKRTKLREAKLAIFNNVKEHEVLKNSLKKRSGSDGHCRNTWVTGGHCGHSPPQLASSKRG